jgi:hypothetical protein
MQARENTGTPAMGGLQPSLEQPVQDVSTPWNRASHETRRGEILARISAAMPCASAPKVGLGITWVAAEKARRPVSRQVERFNQLRFRLSAISWRRESGCPVTSRPKCLSIRGC